MARRKRKAAAKATKKSPKAGEDDQIEEEVDLNDSQTGEDASADSQTDVTSAESQEDIPADPQEENDAQADTSAEMQEDTAAASATMPENTAENVENVLEEKDNEVICEEDTTAAAEEKNETDDEVTSQTSKDEAQMDTSEVQSETTPVEASEKQSLDSDAGKDDDVIMVESDNKENEPIVKIDLTEDDNKVGMEVDDKDSVKKESVVLYVPKYIDYDDENVEIDIDPEFDNLNEKVEGDESADFLKYWRTVSDSPHDFTSWTYLLQLVEQEGKIHLGRRAYNHFFKRYPLCYGYWKKFSEFERKNGNLARAQKILERGVRAIPLSVDLWMHVIDFYTNHYKGLDAGKNKVERVYERALKSAGAEFRSEKLWNKYIQWELVNNDWKAVLEIYDRAIRTQTQHYSVFFNDFKEFVNTHLPKEWMSEDEYNEGLKQVREANEAIKKEKQEEETKDDKEKETEAEDENKDDESKDVDDEEVEPPGDDDIVKPATDQEITSIRLNYIKDKKKVYDETEQAVTKIWAFEEGIKRPYFHVKQLERAQLKNWREYLDMEINRENHNKVILLFERCLIACALYEDFWLKYAKYMAKFDADKAREIYKRACSTHLPKKPNIHMQWAAFEELHGNVEESSRILKQLNTTLPGMAMIRMRRVAVERRAGNYEVAEELLKAYVASAAKDKEEVFYTRKLAWFYFKISNKRDEARKLMKDLIPKYKGDVRLYNDLVEMEFQMAGASTPANDDEERLAIEAFDIALRSDKLTDEQKNSFSQRKVEFLEDYGLDVKRLQKAYDEHQKVLRNQKKRAQTEVAEGNQAKKAKTDTAAISVVGSTQPAANGDPYNSSTTAAAAANYTNPLAQQAGYPGGDPNLYYQQNYWNYQQKPGDPAAAAQYNYSQWGQYYAQQQQQQPQ